MRVLVWLFRAFLFFTLFAFALNNGQDAVVNWFFGYHWRAPMVIIVLAAVAVGAGLSFALMLPALWRARRARPAGPAEAAASPAGSADEARPPAATPQPVRGRLRGRSPPKSDEAALALEHPPREGL